MALMIKINITIQVPCTGIVRGTVPKTKNTEKYNVRYRTSTAGRNVLWTFLKNVFFSHFFTAKLENTAIGKKMQKFERNNNMYVRR